MKNLFAPWRLEFITGKRPEGCVFCKLPSERNSSRENLVLHLGERAYVLMNRYPYTAGHLLVIPLRHTSDFTSLSREENLEISDLLQRSLRVLGEVYRPDGFNLGINLGAAAGAGIREHLHWHVVPRWYGDTNFLPVISATKVLPQLLSETRDMVAAAWPGRPAGPGGTGRP